MDYKDYSGGRDEVEQRIERYPRPPAMIVYTGNGMHAYWHYQAPSGPHWQAALKGALQKVAKDLGADLHAAEPARVLRLAGTFNSKCLPPSRVTLVSNALL
jgi:hypothetical protein